MRRSRGRATAMVITLALMIAVSGTVGYRAVFAEHTTVPASSFADVVDRLPTPANEVWENLLDRSQGLPGVEITSSDICGDANCDSKWGLYSVGQDPTVHGVFAQVNVFAVRKESRLSAAWEYFKGPHLGWEPNRSNEHRMPGRDLSEYADQVRFSCYSYQDPPDEDRDCLWSYYARYGQYVVGILYGSDSRPIEMDRFVSDYVTPFDQFIAQLLDLE